MTDRYRSYWLLLILVGLSAGRLTAQSDWPLAETVSGVLLQNYERSKLMSALSGLEWRSGVTLAVARLGAGQSVSLRLQLTAGRQYAFIGGGNAAVEDLDLLLRRPGGFLLASDREADGSPIVTYTPDRDGTYVVQLHLPTATAEEAIVAVNVMVGGGRALPEAAFRAASTGFDRSVAALLDLTPALDFTTERGQWLLYGLLLDSSEPVTLDRLRLGGEEVYISAAGGEHFRNIELYLGKPDGSVVSGSTRDPVLPLLIHTPDPQLRYRLRVAGTTGGQADLLLLGFFEK